MYVFVWINNKIYKCYGKKYSMVLRVWLNGFFFAPKAFFFKSIKFTPKPEENILELRKRENMNCLVN